MRDPEAVPAEERAAREKGVTYVKLDGEVGILGNGAGLVMSTLDVIALAGGKPANFCDLGGGGDAQGVVDALEVISADPQVRSIFFNIFGGITRCDEVARGILQALDADRRSSSRSSSGSTARTRRRAGGSSWRRARPTCTSRRRCSRPPSWPWSWRHDRRLGRAGAGLPRQRGSSRGPRPRPHRRVGGPGRRAHARSTSPPAAGTSRAGCARPASRSSRTDSVARDAARRDLPRRGSAVRRRAASTSSPAASRRTTSRTSAQRCARWRGSAASSCSSSTTCSSSDAAEEADRVRDPSHVRNLSEAEWRGAAGGRRAPRSRRVEIMDKPIELEPWLARAGCEDEEAERVRELLADRIERRLDHASPGSR